MDVYDNRYGIMVKSWTGLLLKSAAAAAAKSLQSCPTLCDPIDSSPPGIAGILQARTLEWVPFPSPMRESEVAQSCPTLSDPVDCSPPGSSVHGIFQARVLEWSIIAFSREVSNLLVTDHSICIILWLPNSVSSLSLP